ncbi:conserved exported hypothetical protein [Vibrio crassostreae]|nr:conserved exported hypothetical protein [Vibrio crassostreae]CAK2101693.1 conserved exported hypothetical protein [Vibrio crassostreae]CAK2372936.1 conserved exported hypothetical protein [Vibrio crassostreae]CAK2914116.1 conserved exported hypothetical protein [Vibrio crassostreae]CAK2988609.1 conserved exported hypothetical protein [Vibrio crassostreae]
MRLKKTQRLVMLIGSALVLAACQSTPMIATPDYVDCKPTAPQLEWYSVDEGGVYYPKQSYTNLQLYIEALNNCIDDHQE